MDGVRPFSTSMPVSSSMPVSPPMAAVVSVQEAQPNEGLDLEASPVEVSVQEAQPNERLDLEASPVYNPLVVGVDAEPDRESVDACSRIGLTMCGGFCLFLSGSVIVCASIFMSKKLISHTLGVAALKFAIGPCLIGDGVLLYRYRDKVKDTIGSWLEDYC